MWLPTLVSSDETSNDSLLNSDITKVMLLQVIVGYLQKNAMYCWSQYPLTILKTQRIVLYWTLRKMCQKKGTLDLVKMIRYFQIWSLMNTLMVTVKPPLAYYVNIIGVDHTGEGNRWSTLNHHQTVHLTQTLNIQIRNGVNHMFLPLAP